MNLNQQIKLGLESSQIETHRKIVADGFRQAKVLVKVNHEGEELSILFRHRTELEPTKQGPNPFTKDSVRHTASVVIFGLNKKADGQIFSLTDLPLPIDMEASGVSRLMMKLKALATYSESDLKEANSVHEEALLLALSNRH